jgi:hypothetical protein
MNPSTYSSLFRKAEQLPIDEAISRQRESKSRGQSIATGCARTALTEASMDGCQGYQR